jgi:hypothetical protein
MPMHGAEKKRRASYTPGPTVGMIPGRNEAGERSEAYGIPDQGEKRFGPTFPPSDVSNKLVRPTENDQKHVKQD